jgi:hypothetical protein
MSNMPVWRMVKEAVATLDREVSNQEIKQMVQDKHPGTNPTSINCAIISGSVNARSRIHYGENQKARISNTERDYLYRVADGRVTPYNPVKHGIWEIYKNAENTFAVRLVEDSTSEVESHIAEPLLPDGGSSTFALESHLRDYLARNLGSLPGFEGKLSLYVHEDQRDGVEFQTDVGPIDILAISDQNELYVFELKLGRGVDAAMGQILRYMGWITEHLAQGRKVHGVIVAEEIGKKLRYAATIVNQVRLMEYALQFVVKTVALDKSRSPSQNEIEKTLPAS